ncbi:MAG: CBS domain-containing protein [Patescibacteria group bacterium]
MKVKEIMKTNIINFRKGTSIHDVAKILSQRHISGAPVIDEKDRLIGIVSEKDIFRALYPNYEDFYSDLTLRTDLEKIEERIADVANLKVEDVMIKNIISVTPDTSIIKVGAIMLAENIHRIMVLDRNKPCGIVTRRDVYKAIFKDKLKI